jgi:hypothetical protein
VSIRRKQEKREQGRENDETGFRVGKRNTTARETKTRAIRAKPNDKSKMRGFTMKKNTYMWG